MVWEDSSARSSTIGFRVTPGTSLRRPAFCPVNQKLGAIRREFSHKIKPHALPLFDLLLVMSARKGSLSIRPSNEQVIQIFAEMGRTVSRRTVQRWFFMLEKAGVGVRHRKGGQGCDRPSDKRGNGVLPSLPNRRALWTFTAVATQADDFFVPCHVTLIYLDKILAKDNQLDRKSKSSIPDKKADNEMTLPIESGLEPPNDDWFFDPHAYPEADARARAFKRGAALCPYWNKPIVDVTDEEAIEYAEAVLCGAFPPPEDAYEKQIGEWGYGEKWVQFENEVWAYEQTHTHTDADKRSLATTTIAASATIEERAAAACDQGFYSCSASLTGATQEGTLGMFDNLLSPTHTAVRGGHKPRAQRRLTGIGEVSHTGSDRQRFVIE